MKILFCTPTFVTGKGGIPSYARDFVESFKNDYEIVVVTGGAEVNDSPCKLYYVDSRDLSFKNANKLYNIIKDEKLVQNGSKFINYFLNQNLRTSSKLNTFEYKV